MEDCGSRPSADQPHAGARPPQHRHASSIKDVDPVQQEGGGNGNNQVPLRSNTKRHMPQPSVLNAEHHNNRSTVACMCPG